MDHKAITLALLAALAAPIAAQAQQAPLGPPCLVSTNFVGQFFQTNQEPGFPPNEQGATVIDAGVAIGCGSLSQQTSFAGGDWATALFSSVAIGPNAFAEMGAVALGNGSRAVTAGVAVGEVATADAFGVALGAESRAGAGAVAIGAGAIGEDADAVSFGSGQVGSIFGPQTRRLVNVSAGTANTDAATVGQLQPFAGALGGGAGLFGGVLTPPSYLFVSGASFGNVGDALADLDARTAALESGAGGGTGEPFFDASGPAAPATGTEAVAEADNAVAIGAGSVADRDGTVSVGSAGRERQIANVADGSAATDAANVRQVAAGDAWTLRQANTYTDARVSGVELRLDSLVGRVDGIERAVARLDRRIGRAGAIGAASGLMAAATAGNTDTWRLGAAVANYEGHDALAVGLTGGWRARNGRPFAVTFGGSTSGGDSAVGVGLSVGLSGR